MSRSRNKSATLDGSLADPLSADASLLTNTHISALLGHGKSKSHSSDSPSTTSKPSNNTESDDNDGETENTPLSSASLRNGLFHTPPPVDPVRKTWLSENAEKESYGSADNKETLSPHEELSAALKSDVTEIDEGVASVCDIDDSTPGTMPAPENEDETSKTSSSVHSNNINNDETSSIASSASSLSSQSNINHSSTSVATSATVTADSSTNSVVTVVQEESTNKSNIVAAKAASNLPQTLSHSIEKFVSGLKAPRFKSPLEPSAVSLLYQTFYEEFNANADEYLTQSTLSYGAVTDLANGISANSSGDTAGTNSGATDTNSNATEPPLPTSLNALHFRKREIKMETYEEIAEKRRERAMRPIRLKEFNEIAEARSTAMIYGRLFKPLAGTDIARNEEISKRIAALRAIPLTPKLLDFDLEIVDDADAEQGTDKPKITIAKLKELLQPAAEKFKEMDSQQTPAGKLGLFVEGHRLIVDHAISSLYPCKSAAAQPPSTPAPEPLQATATAPSAPISKRHSIISDTGLKSNFLRRTTSSDSASFASSSTSRRTSILSAQQQYQQQQDQQRRTSLSTLLLSNNSSNISTIPEIANSTGPRNTSAAAADSILPLLIYTFVQFDIPDIWLQLAYIMRYRNSAVTSAGEVAYLLTNLQAVIGFIETSTLNSLGIEDNYPHLKEKEHDKTVEDPVEILLNESPFSNDFTTFTDPPSSIPSGYQTSVRARLRHHRRTQFSADPSAVGTNSLVGGTTDPAELVYTADQSIKALGTTFGNSYRFLLNKINNARENESSMSSLENQQESTTMSTEFTNALKTRARKSSVSTDDNPGKSSESPPPQRLNRKTSASSIISSISSSNNSSSAALATDHTSSTGTHQNSEPLLGRLVRTLRNSSEQSSSPSPTPVPPGKLAPPNETLLNKEWTSLTVKDIETLHQEYKRLAEYLKSINAFPS